MNSPSGCFRRASWPLASSTSCRHIILLAFLPVRCCHTGTMPLASSTTSCRHITLARSTSCRHIILLAFLPVRCCHTGTMPLASSTTSCRHIIMQIASGIDVAIVFNTTSLCYVRLVRRLLAPTHPTTFCQRQRLVASAHSPCS